MSLLEVITKAATNPTQLADGSNYPITLNSEPILLNLKPLDDTSNDSSLVKRVQGWAVSDADTELMKSSNKLFKKLKRELKNPNTLIKDDFLGTLVSFLEKNSKKFGVSAGIESSEEGYSLKLIEKAGFLMGRELKGLVLEASVAMELWEVIETLLVHGLVEHSCSSNLVENLIEKMRSDLICLCVKHLPDLQASDILSILRYFLSPPKGAYDSMLTVRQGWEGQATSAIEKATDSMLSSKKKNLAKEASVLLMLAHDGFSVNEMCLHYLFASSNLDEVIMASCVGQLKGSEISGLVRYLGKWLRKYERFPQAGPCGKASSSLGLKSCEWVPTLAEVAKCLGLVLDEHFSSLVLHSEFHQELRSLQGIVDSLALESRLCCSITNVIENLRTETEG